MKEMQPTTTVDVCLDGNPLPPPPGNTSSSQYPLQALPEHVVIDHCTTKCPGGCALKPLPTEE